MRESKSVLGLKKSRDFSIEERKMIIEEYLKSGKTKREIWENHTGYPEEHGQLLKWMRNLGYCETKRTRIFEEKFTTMAKSKEVYSIENEELKSKINELEKALINSELRATMYETMVEVAEKQFKINIKKKSNTK